MENCSVFFRFGLGVATVCGAFSASSAYAKTLTVAQDGSGQYSKINLAIADAVAGDTISVGPGTYKENINFVGKAITVVSSKGPETTILDGSGATVSKPFSAVNFNASENATSVLDGFTITKGKGTLLSGVYYGGGIYVAASAPTLRNLIIAGNNATVGGGIYCGLNGSPAIRNVQVLNNTSSSTGGGMAFVQGSPTLQRVTISGNLANGTSSDGGGLYAYKSKATLTNVLINENSAGRNGGGLFTDGGALNVSFTTIVSNIAQGTGGGLYAGSTTPLPIFNSIIVAFDQKDEIDIRSADTQMSYSDVFGKAATGSSTPTGTGNINADPEFAAYSVDGDFTNDDFHLLATSPCIDTGDKAISDVDGSRADMGQFGGPDSGYSGSEQDTDGDGLPDIWEVQFGTDPDVDDSGADPDLDGLSNLEEYEYGTDPDNVDSDGDGVEDGDEVLAGQNPADAADNRPVAAAKVSSTVKVGVAATLDGTDSSDPNGDPLAYQWSVISVPEGSGVNYSSLTYPKVAVTQFTPDVDGEYRFGLVVSDGKSNSLEYVLKVTTASSNFSVPGDFSTIQAAIDAVPDSATIQVGPGTYKENIDFHGKQIKVIATGGPEQTTLQGAGGNAVVTFINGETLAVLDGFTITGGTGAKFSAQSYGGGIYIFEASPTVRNCVITANSATFGGGIYLSQTAATVTGCTIRTNTATNGGGVMLEGADSLPVLTLDLIESNSATTGGGGVYISNYAAGTLNNLWIYSNKATLATGTGGGLSLNSASPIVSNCVIAGNQSGSTVGGGGVYVSNGSAPTFTNNTVVYNKAASTGGGALQLDSSQGEYSNNILGYSQGGVGFYPRASSEAVFTYNDVFGNAAGQYCTTTCGSTDLTGKDGNLSVDPRFSFFIDNGDYTDDAFLLQAASPLINVGDPALKDPDGTRSDIGAYGGPDADKTALFADSDSDGLPDWWELLYALDTTGNDALEDPDDDDLTNAQEYADGTNPTKADSDDDGVDDGVEVSEGSNPTDPSDHRPTAVAGPDKQGLPGVKIVLDGSQSFDPNGDILAFQWTLKTKPASSSLSQAGLAGADTPYCSFVPDVAGDYTLTLVVSDGAAFSDPDTVAVTGQKVFTVPKQYATIQDAIAAATDGTRVEVSSGSYTESIDFLGKAITVVAVDTTKATTLSAPKTGGSAVTFKTKESAKSVLQGFTVTGGTGTVKGGNTRYGGAVYIEDASPTLVDLIIDANKADYGAGVACRVGGAPAIRRVTFTANTAVTAGGAIYAEICAPAIQAGVLTGNQVTASGVGGGAIAMLTSSSGSIANNLILGNTSAGDGGAVFLNNASPLIINNTMVGNSGTVAGGVAATGSTSELKNNIIVFSVAGAGVSNEDPAKSLTIDYNDFFGNKGGNFAGSNQSDPVGQDGNISLDPLFVKFSNDSKYTNDDFHLGASSPCVNAGDAAQSDVNGTRADMGAYGGPGMYYQDFDVDGFTGDEGDCDDNNAKVNPSAIETSNGLDDNCDGQVDEGTAGCEDAPTVAKPTPKPTPTPKPGDDDATVSGDDDASSSDCVTPTPAVCTGRNCDNDADGFTKGDGDCNDEDPNVYPGQTEVPGNGIDDNCDGCVDKNSCPTPTPEPTATPEPTPTPETASSPTPTQEPAASPTPPAGDGSDSASSCSCSIEDSRPAYGGVGLLALCLLAMGRRRR